MKDVLDITNLHSIKNHIVLSTEQEPKSPQPSSQKEGSEKANSKWNVKRVIATVVSLLVAIIILFLCKTIVDTWNTKPDATASESEAGTTDSLKLEEKALPLKEVSTILIANKNIKSGFSVQGRLRAYDKTDIVAEVQGMMRTLDKRFKIGTRYTKDEVMIDIDNVESHLGIKAQKAQLHTAITAMMPDMKVDMPNSFNNWKNYLDKFSVDNPIHQFPKALSDREEYYVSTKNLHSQYYNIKSAEVRLGKFQVRAPFDGVLTAANVNEGGFVRAGISLGTLMNTSTFEMEAGVEVAELKYIERGSSVKVVSDDSGKSWNGKVIRISDLVDPTTQAATVYISLSGNGLREGQYLRAIINTSAITQASEIPRSWLVDSDQLYVVENGELKLEKINVVKIEGDNAIVKGLENGTAVLSEKVKGAFVGMKVTF